MNLKKVIYLSRSDYATLIAAGTVTINGTVLTYDPANLYIVPEDDVEIADLGGIDTITASGTSPLTLTASKSGTTVTITGSVSTYAGGTKVTLNGTDNGGLAVSIYAPINAGTAGQLLKSKGANTAPEWGNLTSSEVTTALGFTPYNSTNPNGYTTNTGTVTSVRVQATSPVVSSVNTAASTTLNTTISLADGYGDTKNPYASKTKNQILAAPSSENGVPSFRALVSEDLPTFTKATGSTVAVGGIPKGTTFSNKSIIDILEDMLYPYVKPSGFSFTLTPIAGNVEYGTSVTVTAIKPTFTAGSKGIAGIKFGNTSGGSNFYSHSTATSGTVINIPVENQTTQVVTSDYYVYGTLSDNNSYTNNNSNNLTSLTANAKYTPVYYVYYQVTPDSSAPTSGCTRTTSTTSGDSTITIQEPKNGEQYPYIWFYSKTAKTKLQQYALGQWNDVPTTPGGQVSLRLNTGAEVTYFTYRTDRLRAGTVRYQVV